MKYFNIVSAVVFLAIYALGYIPPSERLNLWLGPFVIPVALVLNIVLILFSAVRRKLSTLFLVAALIFGADYLISTIGIQSMFRVSATDGRSFTLLSYNLSAFNVGQSGGKKPVEAEEAEAREIVDWLIGNGPDIACLQEFLRYFPKSREDVLTLFKEAGYDVYYSADMKSPHRSVFGTLIVSRFPIVATGDVLASRNGYNRISYADVALGPDTVRIVNVHLQSMQMKAFHPGYAEDFDARRRDVRVVLQKLKAGVFERSNQIDSLVDFVGHTQYPVICAGDFNEIPYSYSYRKLRGALKNSFEKSGRGFGFTYNGRTLGMLRIDNQFFSDPLKCQNFSTLQSVTYTDHFPLLGQYVLP